MSTEKERQDTNEESQILKFYHGKTVLITGAAGFLGAVMLEILLRCCPDIQKIYILLRPKKGVQPEDRKESIFNKEIFDKLKEKNPDALEKVKVIPGDTSKKGLGMNEEDLLKVKQEVSIVFHIAAVINFLRPLRYMLEQNFQAANHVLEFCRNLAKLECLVYTSTAYSNSNRIGEIEEKVYKLPFSAESVLEILKTGSDDDLTSLFNKCEPKFPNFYTFTKCLSENLLAEKASDLPVAIVRPSIIISCWKGPLPGYIEGSSGIVNLSLGVGKGFIRVVLTDGDKQLDYIPVDVVANTHIVAACYQVKEKFPSPKIYNCVGSEFAPATWREFYDVLFDLVKEHPLPNSYQKPGITMCKSTTVYWAYSIIEHYIPAVIIDTLLYLAGRKPRLFKLYRFYDTAMYSIRFFVFREWKFLCDNYKYLLNKLNSIDSEMFFMDLTEYNLREMSRTLPTGAPLYKWENDRRQKKERMRTTYMRYYFNSFIKLSIMGSMSALLYLFVF